MQPLIIIVVYAMYDYSAQTVVNCAIVIDVNKNVHSQA